MKALSLTQPWATLVSIGAKRYETRGWKTTLRGTIAVHASKGFPKSCRELCSIDPFKRFINNLLSESGYQLPLGSIIALADITEIYQTDDLFSTAILPDSAEHEKEFGNYSPGRFAWKLENVRRLRYPVPCKGALSLWEVPADVLSHL